MNLAGKKIISIVVTICLLLGNSFGSMDLSWAYAEEIISPDDSSDLSENGNIFETSDSIENANDSEGAETPKVAIEDTSTDASSEDINQEISLTGENIKNPDTPDILEGDEVLENIDNSESLESNEGEENLENLARLENGNNIDANESLEDLESLEGPESLGGVENLEGIENVGSIVTGKNSEVEQIWFSAENTVTDDSANEDYQIFIGGVVNDDRTINIWWDGVADASVDFCLYRNNELIYTTGCDGTSNYYSYTDTEIDYVGEYRYRVDVVLRDETEDRILSQSEEYLIGSEVFVVSEDMVLTSDMQVNNLQVCNNAELKLNGHMLTVFRECRIIEGGKINVNADDFVCYGDFYSTDSSPLRMNAYGHALIYGDFVAINEDMTMDGTYEFKGDFLIRSRSCNGYTADLIFSGDKKQAVEYSTINEATYVQYVSVESITNINTSAEGLSFDGAYPLFADCYEEKNGSQAFSNGKRLFFATENINLNEDMTIEGSLVFVTYGTSYLNGHTMTVKGDLFIPYGCLQCDSGQLYVDGSLIVAQHCAPRTENNYPTDESEVFSIWLEKCYDPGSGYIYMSGNDNILVHINGDFIHSSTSSSQFYNGILEVEGDYLVGCPITYGAYVYSYYHKLILKGNGKQHVYIANANADNMIYDLEILNEVDGGVEFIGYYGTYPTVSGTLTTHGHIILGYVGIAVCQGSCQ